MSFYLNKLRNFDNYRWFALFSFPLGLALLLLLISTGSIDLGCWYSAILSLTSTFGELLSGSTYLARVIDVLTQKTLISQKNPLKPDVKHPTEAHKSYLEWRAKNVTKESIYLKTLLNYRVYTNRPTPKIEGIGTLLGILIGLTIFIALVAVHFIAPPIGVLTWIYTGQLLIGLISIYGGLGNRLGSILATNSSRRPLEKILMGLGLLIGLASGTLIWLHAVPVVFAFVAFGSLFTGGLALPTFIIMLIFISATSSAGASAADYISRSVYPVKDLVVNVITKLTKRPSQNSISNRFREYCGACVGISAGLSLGLFVILTKKISLTAVPIVMLPVTVTMILIKYIGTFGGFFSRTGRLSDGFAQLPLSKRSSNVESDYLQALKTIDQVLSDATQSFFHSSFSKKEQALIQLHHNIQQADPTKHTVSDVIKRWKESLTPIPAHLSADSTAKSETYEAIMAKPRSLFFKPRKTRSQHLIDTLEKRFANPGVNAS